MLNLHKTYHSTTRASHSTDWHMNGEECKEKRAGEFSERQIF